MWLTEASSGADMLDPCRELCAKSDIARVSFPIRASFVRGGRRLAVSQQP